MKNEKLTEEELAIEPPPQIPNSRQFQEAITHRKRKASKMSIQQRFHTAVTNGKVTMIMGSKGRIYVDPVGGNRQVVALNLSRADAIALYLQSITFAETFGAAHLAQVKIPG